MALNKRKVLEAARKFAQKGAKARALKEYDKLLKEDPRDAKLLLEVGDAYRRWGQNEDAISQYLKVAGLYRQEGFDARAVAVFKQILKLDSKNYGAFVSLAELYQRMGLDAEAASALQTAADGYHHEGREAEALDLLRQMAALDPTNTTSRLKVAELLRQEGMEREALDEYRAVVEELESQNDREQLVVVLERLIELKADDVAALSRLVRCFMESGEFVRAESIAERAVNVGDDVPQYELLMELYAQMGEDLKLAEATRGLARAYRARGDEERARELMQRIPVAEMSAIPRLAVDVTEMEDPEVEDVELLDDEDDFLSAGPTALVSERSDPTESGRELEIDFSGGSGLLGLDTDQRPNAAMVDDDPDLSASAVTARPQPVPVSGDPDQLLAEASVYLRYGKQEQAIASLQGILDQVPDHPFALDKMGQIHAQEGRAQEALETWMSAVEGLRAQGGIDALTALRDRVAELDPARAAQIELAPPVELPALELELTLEDAIDLEEPSLDEEEALEAGEQGDLELEIEVDELEIELSSVEDGEVEPGFDLDLDTADLDEELACSSDALEIGFEEADADSLAPAAATTLSASTVTRLSEELEEAEFYVSQGMYDEAERLIRGILNLVPGHPSALLRLGEIEAAREASGSSDVPDGSSSQSQSASLAMPVEVGIDLGPAVELDVLAEEEGSLEPKSPNALDTTTTWTKGEDRAAPELVMRGFDTELTDLDMAGFDTELTDLDMAGFDTEPTDLDTAGVDTEASDVETPDEAVVEAESTSGPTSVDATGGGEGTFDLREALSDLFVEEPTSHPDRNEESQVLSTVEDGFESIFSDFKRGVSATLDHGDFETRYDLGIAYREMGLYADAIAEFRFCLDSPDRRFESLHLMGLCARDLGRFAESVSHLEQALSLPDLPEDRLAGVYFDLSVAHEGVGDVDRALASVRRVLELDPGFPGAATRRAALESSASDSLELGEPGEGFVSFDDLFTDEDDEFGDGGVVDQVSAAVLDDETDGCDGLETAEVGGEEHPGTSADAKSETPPENDPIPRPRRAASRKKISFV